MGHCLYAGDPDVFLSLLIGRARESFDAWRADHLSVAGVA